MGSRSPAAWFVALICAVALATSAAAPGAAALEVPAPGTWIRPVTGALAQPFVEPRSRYGAGHRGVDFVAALGTPVRAANSGEVTFAGNVAGSLHVVVTHAGGLRTSSSFLATIAVRRGQQVARGDVLGTAGGGDGEHAGVLHFGLRVGDRYVDPMALFAPADLTRLIRLVPVDTPEQAGFDPPAVESRSLAESLHLPQASGDLIEPHQDSGPLDGLASAFSDVVAVAGALSAPMQSERQLLGAGASWLWRSSPAAPIVADAGSMAERLLAWARSREDCVDDASQPSSGGGSGHLALTIAGIDSATDPVTGTALAIDTDRLGYRDGEVRSFSYAPDGGPYRREQTWSNLRDAAQALANQLRGIQRADPGREVDLIAHSQGGVVVAEFLAHVYDAGDPALPPLGNVVTLSSPLQGVPAATAVARVRESKSGRAVLDEVDRRAGGAIPPTGATSTAQLAEGSSLTRGLGRSSLPEQIDLTSISAADDVVVPADHTTVPGARSVTVNPAGVSDHTGILRDPAALDAARLALELRPLPCVGIATGVRGAVEPVLISRGERSAGQIGGALAHASDLLLGKEDSR